MPNLLLEAVSLSIVSIDGNEYPRRKGVVTFDDNNESLTYDNDGVTVVNGKVYSQIEYGPESLVFSSYTAMKAWVNQNMAFTGIVFKNGAENSGALLLNGYPYGKGKLYAIWDNDSTVQEGNICVRYHPRDTANIINVHYDQIFLNESITACTTYQQLKDWVEGNFWRKEYA